MPASHFAAILRSGIKGWTLAGLATGRTLILIICLVLATLPARADGVSPALDKAFEAAQWAFLSSAGKALQQFGARAAAGDAALEALVRKRQDLIAAATEREAAVAAGAAGRSERLIRLRGEIDSLRGEVEQLDSELASRFPGYADLVNPAPLPVTAVQALLAEGESLLFFLAGSQSIFTFAIGKHDAAWHRGVYGAETLARDIATLRATLDPQGVDRGAKSLAENPGGPSIAPFDRTIPHLLYLELIEPVAHVLEGSGHVYVVADGPLAGLPLSILVTERPSGRDDDPAALRDTAWFVKRHAFTTLPTVGGLAVLRAQKRRAGDESGRAFRGFGAPVLGGVVATPVSASAERDFFRGVHADVAAVRNLPSLPQTGPELRRLAESLGSDESSVFLGVDAREAIVKSLDLSDTRVLAFATHGLLSGDLRGLAEPALVLTPPEVATSADDGLLTASEIAELRLSADWVILSACNTAGGDGKPDAEGLSGLARAFLYAGARAILVSHWPVRDDAAARLTTATIDNMRTNASSGRSQALREAMLGLMADERDPTFAHPATWAPFVIVGEGG